MLLLFFKEITSVFISYLDETEKEKHKEYTRELALVMLRVTTNNRTFCFIQNNGTPEPRRERGFFKRVG